MIHPDALIWLWLLPPRGEPNGTRLGLSIAMQDGLPIDEAMRHARTWWTDAEITMATRVIGVLA